MKELWSTLNIGLEVPWQYTFKDKPVFIKWLTKVLLARNLFLVHSSSFRNNRLSWKQLQVIYINTRNSIPGIYWWI